MVPSSNGSDHKLKNMEVVFFHLSICRREEAEQLKAANNSLRLELERFQGLETQLQVQLIHHHNHRHHHHRHHSPTVSCES